MQETNHSIDQKSAMTHQPITPTVKEESQEVELGNTEPEITNVESLNKQSSAKIVVKTSKHLLEHYRLAAIERRKEAIYAIKPIALVEDKLQYEYGDLEESLVAFLLEKVVVMREVPFMRAMEQLEKNQNVSKIYD